METKQLIITASVGAVGVAAGFGVGYILAKKKFEAYADEEIESVRQSYIKATTPKPELEDLVQNVAARHDEEPPVREVVENIVRRQNYISPNTETDADAFQKVHGRAPTTYELIQMGAGVEIENLKRDPHEHDDDQIEDRNVFDENAESQPDPEDLGEGELEIPPRSIDKPYIISDDEWFSNLTNYDQITLTYFADDQILISDDKQVIRNVEEIVGETNLHRFGVQSDNPDIVYVRNELLKADYEVTKDERSYTEVILGINPDEVNTTGVPRRMRSDDD